MNKNRIVGVILFIIQILITKNGIPVDTGGSGSVGESIGFYIGVFLPTIIGVVLIFNAFKKNDGDISDDIEIDDSEQEANDISNFEYELRELKNIFEKGILTKEEYEMKRKLLIEEDL